MITDDKMRDAVTGIQTLQFLAFKTFITMYTQTASIYFRVSTSKLFLSILHLLKSLKHFKLKARAKIKKLENLRILKS